MQWQRIAALLPGKVSDPGRSVLDNRLFVNGVLRVLRSGARWSDLAERYGKYKSAMASIRLCRSEERRVGKVLMPV